MEGLETGELCCHSAALSTLAAASYMKSQWWALVTEEILNLPLENNTTYVDKERGYERMAFEVRSELFHSLLWKSE